MPLFFKLKSKVKFAFILSIVFTFSGLWSYGQQINVFPTILNFQLTEAGSLETQSINITNNSKTKQAITAYFGDWTRNEDGSHSYYEPSSQPYSCASWAILNSNLLELEPGQTAQLILTLQAPKDQSELEEMKWAMLFLQSTTIREPKKNDPTKLTAQINEIVRLGLHIYQTPGTLDFTAVSLNGLKQNEENSRAYDLSIKNEGQVMVKAKSYLELTNIATGEEFRSELEECPIFPLGKRKVSLLLPADLPNGKYSMLAIMDYGNPNSLEAIEQIIEIK